MQKDGEFKEHVEDLRHKANVHPFLKRYCEVGVREGLFSDAVNAIGRLHDTLVQAAYPEMIGRSIITVRPTTEAMERFPLDEKAGEAKRVVDSFNENVNLDALLCDMALRHKTLSISDSLGLDDLLYGDKTFLLGDSASLSELITVIISEATKYVADAVNVADVSKVLKNLKIPDTLTLFDTASTPSRVLQALDTVGLSDYSLVNKTLQINETISLAEVVETGVGGVKKTRLFLIIGDLAVQLTGD